MQRLDVGELNDKVSHIPGIVSLPIARLIFLILLNHHSSALMGNKFPILRPLICSIKNLSDSHLFFIISAVMQKPTKVNFYLICPAVNTNSCLTSYLDFVIFFRHCKIPMYNSLRGSEQKQHMKDCICARRCGSITINVMSTT